MKVNRAPIEMRIYAALKCIAGKGGAKTAKLQLKGTRRLRRVPLAATLEVTSCRSCLMTKGTHRFKM
jgi:hypothetical protein